MALLEAFATPLDERNPAAAHAALLNARYGELAHARRARRRRSIDEFPGEIALVSSFGAESAVLLHLAASVDAERPGDLPRHRQDLRRDARATATSSSRASA